MNRSRSSVPLKSDIREVSAFALAVLLLMRCLVLLAQEPRPLGAEQALRSILSLSVADTSKATAIIRQCSPTGARVLFSMLMSAAGKSFDAGDLDKSSFYYLCAVEAAKRSGDDRLLAEAEYRLGTTYLHRHDYLKAEESLLEGLRLSRQQKFEIGVINCLGTLGSAYIRLAKYDAAERASKEALALVTVSPVRTSIPILYGEAMVSGNLGAIAEWNGEHASALRYFGRAYEIHQQLDEKIGGYRFSALDNLLSIGEVHYYLGDYREALDCYGKVQTAAEKKGYKRLLQSVFNDLAVLYMDQADFVKATELFSRSLNTAAQLGDEEAVTLATCNLGVCDERQGMYKRAAERFGNCLRLANQSARPGLSILALEGLAAVYRSIGQHGPALESFDKALHIATTFGDKLRQSELAWWKALVYYDLGDYARSLELSALARTLADEIQEANYSYLALSQSGKCLLALNQFDAARANLESAIRKVEQIRSRIGGQEQQRAFFFERRVEPYYLMVDLLARQNRPEEALVYAEQARCRTLVDLAGSSRLEIAKAMSPDESRQEQSLEGQLTSLNTRLFREYQQKKPDGNRVADLKARLERTRVDYESFMDRLYVTHPELRVDRGQAAPFSAKDMSILPASRDAAFIEFEVLDNKVYIFILSAGDGGQFQIRAYPVSIGRRDLAERVRLFRDRIANNSLGVDKLSSEIFQLLLGAAAPVLQDKKTVILVPDDVLWELPFQALKNSSGRYLIEDHAVFYAPSLTLLREMRRRESAGLAAEGVSIRYDDPNPGSAAALLAFGDPASLSGRAGNQRTRGNGENLGPLVAARKQVETLRKLYGASRCAVFVGADATEDKAKAEMTRYRILHFATHGILDGANPLYSHVVLSPPASGSNEDGLLEAREIMKMSLKADLTVLSACQTARGRVSRGEGVIGMSWALFVAGCPSSVVSQWSVESDSSARLMIEFHRALLSSNSDSGHFRGAAAAMREAALKMIKLPNRSHPFYWAGFIVVGDGW